MAKDEKKPTAAEKGKGKAENADGINGDRKSPSSQREVNGKPVTNGKLSDDFPEGMLLREL